MGYINIKTPLYEKNGKHTNILPHLLEHIVATSFKPSIQEYFKHIIYGEAGLHNGYTGIEFSSGSDWNETLSYITKPFSREHFEAERKAIREEIEDLYTSFDSVLHNKITQLLYGKAFNLLSKRKPNFRETIEYHKKRFQKENMLVTGEGYDILFAGQNINLEYSKTNILDNIPFQTHVIPKKTGSLICISIGYTCREAYHLAFFIYDLLDNFIRYKQRYQDHIYYYDEVEFVSTIQHLNIVLPNDIDYSISKDFFDACKNSYINHYSEYGYYWKVINCMKGFGYVQNDDALSFIEEINFDAIKYCIKKREVE